jgi:hypothetical protein
MPRASWRGFLRLSLVSCPIYLSPATARTKPIRLHQVWQPAPVDVDEDDLPDRGGGRQGSAPSVPRLLADDARPEEDQSPAATRVTLRPHDPATGEEIDKREVVKGYEYARGEFVTFTAEELKALDVESSKIIDLEKFVPSAGIDPVYFSQFLGVAKRQRHPIMPRRCVRRILPRRAYSADLEVRKRLQSRNMSDRGKATARICPDKSYADLVSVKHEITGIRAQMGPAENHATFYVLFIISR